jgi:hypothetical protein
VREIACQCRACLRPWLAFTEHYAVYLWGVAAIAAGTLAWWLVWLEDPLLRRV